MCGKIHVTAIVVRKDNSIDNFIKDAKNGVDHMTVARKKILLAAPHVKVHRTYLELTEEETGIAKATKKQNKNKKQKQKPTGTSLVVQWLRLHASNAGGSEFDLWLRN